MRQFLSTPALVTLFAAAGGLAVLYFPPPAGGPGATGWVNDPAAVGRVVGEIGPGAHFSETPAFRAVGDGDVPENVFLWDAAREATGDLLPPRDQGSVGSCVSFGTASAVEHLICVQIVNARRAGRPPPTECRDLAQEVIYGGSRVEIGGGRIRGDGSVGAWAARFVQQYGVVARGKYGGHDLSKYSESTCRDYGRNGCPDDLEPVAKKSPVKGVALVKSFDELRKAIGQGYPVAVCSDQGFTMARDADGFCSPRGTWNHCMAVVGVRGGVRPGAFVLNSWGGKAHTGPRGLGDPSPAGFWADARVVDRMLRQGDSWAFSDAVGFPPRKIDWLVKADAPGFQARPLAWAAGRDGWRPELVSFAHRGP